MDITKLKPSELIRVGLSDLLIVNSYDEYQINMDQWHTPSGDTTCQVCMAGAVMVQRLNAEPQNCYEPADFSLLERAALVALDTLRIGLVHIAFSQLHLDMQEGRKFNREMSSWYDDRSRFVSDILELASDLEEAGY